MNSCLKVIIFLGIFSFTVAGFANSSSKTDQEKVEEQKQKTLEKAQKLTEKNHFNQAMLIYQDYLRHYPNDKDAWISYIEMEDSRTDYNEALRLLRQYCLKFGPDKLYWSREARVLSDANFYQSSEAINHHLLAQYPKDDEILGTHILNLSQTYDRSNTLDELDTANKYIPKSDELRDIGKQVRDPLKTIVSFQPDFLWQNSTVTVTTLPLIVDYYVTPTTRFYTKLLFEELTASLNSGNQTIENTGNINDYSFLTGFRQIVTPQLEVGALGGALKVQDINGVEGKETGIYQFDANFLPNQYMKINALVMHDLFRPYFRSSSPLAVSLGITETAGQIDSQIHPFIDTHIELLGRTGSLSDTNNYWDVQFEPKKRVFTYDNLYVELGIFTEWLSYRKDLSQNGYYSPTLYQDYELATNLVLQANSNATYSVRVGGGALKDNTFSNFVPGVDVNAAADFAILDSTWQLTPAYEFIYQNTPQQPYVEHEFTLAITKRF